MEEAHKVLCYSCKLGADDGVVGGRQSESSTACLHSIISL